MPAPSNPIVLYDGVCGLCNRLVQFILRRDRDDKFRFASLQSPFAAGILQRHAFATDLNTVFVVLNYRQPSEHLLARSGAVLFIFQELGYPWALWGNVGHLAPRFLRDVVYNRIARNRYRILGKYDTCPIPDPDHRHKFLDA
jgi:predicted DCC family thiol-disulfide oxidoreductase YuxK